MVLEKIRRDSVPQKRNGESSKTQISTGGQQFMREGARVRARIANLDAEIHGYQEDIKSLQNRLELCFQERSKLEAELNQAQRQNSSSANGTARKQGTNYATEMFEWSDALKKRMKEVFNINDFRLSQRG